MSARYEQSGIAEGNGPLDELVLAHAELVKRIAYHLLARLPAHIEVEDLIQAGMIVLISAARHYSADKGANFETYAGIRIRGAMLDEVRKSATAPRSTLRRARQVAAAISEVERREGRDARTSEIAEALGIGVDEVHRLLESAASSRPLSFEQLNEDPERAALLPESADPAPDELLDGEQFRQALAEAIRALPEREQLVLSLYYQDELNLREIGEVLNVSESRVCQIHGQAVLRIRARLEEWLT